MTYSVYFLFWSLLSLAFGLLLVQGMVVPPKATTLSATLTTNTSTLEKLRLVAEFDNVHSNAPKPAAQAGGPIDLNGTEFDPRASSMREVWKIQVEDNWKTQSNCKCEQMEESAEETTMSYYSALIVGPILAAERGRRHATSLLEDECGNQNVPFLVFVGILTGVVMFGILIGIIAMCAYWIRDICSSILSCCNSCCRRCCKINNNNSTSCCCRCKINNKVTSTCEDNSQDQDNIASAHEDEEEHPGGNNDIIICAPDPEPKCFADQSTCTDRVETSEVGTSTMNIVAHRDAAVQFPIGGTITVDHHDAAVQVKIGHDRPSPSATPSTPSLSSTLFSISSLSDEPDVPRRKTIDDTPTSNGECLLDGCTNCPSHKNDQREVKAHKAENINKLIRASRDTDLKPGSYIF